MARKETVPKAANIIHGAWEQRIAHRIPAKAVEDKGMGDKEGGKPEHFLLSPSVLVGATKRTFSTQTGYGLNWEFAY